MQTPRPSASPWNNRGYHVWRNRCLLVCDCWLTNGMIFKDPVCVINKMSHRCWPHSTKSPPPDIIWKSNLGLWKGGRKILPYNKQEPQATQSFCGHLESQEEELLRTIVRCGQLLPAVEKMRSSTVQPDSQKSFCSTKNTVFLFSCTFCVVSSRLLQFYTCIPWLKCWR